MSLSLLKLQIYAADLKCSQLPLEIALQRPARTCRLFGREAGGGRFESRRMKLRVAGSLSTFAFLGRSHNGVSSNRASSAHIREK